MKTNALTMLALALGAWATGVHAADAQSPSQKKAQRLAMTWCGECHGRDGNAISPQFPRLAGQPEEYLDQELKALRKRTRTNTDAQDYMWGVVHKMDDATIGAIARYFSEQKPTPGPGTANSVLAERGKVVFETKPPVKDVGSCASCHGKDAEGKDEAPRLAGQHVNYLIKQLKVIQAGQRPAPDEMHDAVRRLSNDDIAAVAEYLQSK